MADNGRYKYDHSLVSEYVFEAPNGKRLSVLLTMPEAAVAVKEYKQAGFKYKGIRTP